MFDIATLKNLLAIDDGCPLDPANMGQSLSVVFYPYGKASATEISFSKRLEQSLRALGVKVVPMDDVLEELSLKQKWKIASRVIRINLGILARKLGLPIKDEHVRNISFPFKISLGRRIKRGHIIIATGEGEIGQLPMDRSMSFRENQIVTILDKPQNISDKSSYLEHMEAALHIFCWHMTNIGLAVSDRDFTVYSFNGAHPTHPINDDFNDCILNNLLPKLAAPVKPPRMKDFTVSKGSFDPLAPKYAASIRDLLEGGAALGKTGLYPERKAIGDLDFRNSFYRWVGSVHLDKRSGMSYGFVAKQLPAMPTRILSESEAAGQLESLDGTRRDAAGNAYLPFTIGGQLYYIELPSVSVLASKSGADKSKLDPKTDIVKMGLENGRMTLAAPAGIDIDNGDYKPSFDTKVILAHALGNALISSLIARFQPEWRYPKILAEQGMGIAHWHGYIEPATLPAGWHMFGQNNPSVSCSSPQSAVYALRDKLALIERCLADRLEYRGDAQIEPHHGTNINYPSLTELADKLISKSISSELG